MVPAAPQPRGRPRDLRAHGRDGAERLRRALRAHEVAQLTGQRAARLDALPGTRVDIRWRDLDAYGHVNNAVYLTYAEEVLDAWLRETLGLAPGTVWDYVTARAAVDYRSELRQRDLAVVGTVALVRVGTKSVTAAIELHTPDGRLAAEIEAVAVAFDRARGESRPLTAAERAAFEGA